MTRVRLEHGAGGRAMRRLIEELFVRGFGSAELAAMDDGAAIPIGDRWLIITTDSHVVSPLFFPGGDIGRLAVCGTVNDLAMMGATEVLALTSAVVIEEGLLLSELERVQRSMADTCEEAQVKILTGDTKVMRRGELDRLIINTTGIGFAERVVTDRALRPGDRLIVTGNLAEHGFAVLDARQGLGLSGDLRSDVAPLGSLIRAALAAAGDSIVAMKDPTRGGVASALHEMAHKSGVGILLDEPSLPLSDPVRAASELLGIDPLHVANEGKAIIGVRPEASDAVLARIQAHPLGTRAAIIGTCIAEHRGSVILDTGFGKRLVAELEGEPLPRIC
jgi:hydrogenase expression/formation protein HypE